MPASGFCRPGPGASGAPRLAGVKRDARTAPGLLDPATPEAAPPGPPARDVPAFPPHTGCWSGLLAGLGTEAPEPFDKRRPDAGVHERSS